MSSNEAWMTDITSVTGKKLSYLSGVCSDALDIKKKKNHQTNEKPPGFNCVKKS